jgi:3-methyladenine DNA glycosylase/8-oxoguanine DNA glycosylase
VGTRLTIPSPADFALARDVCSYGYFLLAPNVWDPAAKTLTRPLNLPEGVATATLAQPEGAGAPVRIAFERALARHERAPAKAMLARMLRLDDDLTDFHRVDPRWKASGRGRLFRSPTFFEDLIKTVTSCNVTWPSTVSMNRRLCAAFNPAFPTPAQLRRRRPATLRSRCGVGYRDARIVELARIVDAGELDVPWLEDAATPDDAVYDALLALPGIGPYGAANVMMLLGRYERLAIDTETFRHARTVLGMEGDDRELARRVRAHYEPFGAHKFRSYWFEVWSFYEGRRGPSWEWAPREVADAFTASKLK